MANKKTLGLYIPEQEKPGPNSLAVKPKKLVEWVNSLPRGSVGETARLVYNLLKEINRQHLSVSARLKFLELIAEPFVYIGTNLQRRFTGVSFPLTDKNRRVYRLCREMNLEMANAYKALVEDIAGGSASRTEQKALANSLFLAMHYLNQVHYHASLTYDPPTEHLWWEMNRLYLYAEKNKLHKLKIKLPSVLMPKNDETDILSIYKQALLLALASPSRLQQKETNQLYNVLPQWTSLVSLEDDIPEEERYWFAIELNTDEPPRYISLHTASTTPSCRFLFTRALIRRLRRQLKQQEEGIKTDGDVFSSQELALSQHFIKQLGRSWTEMPKRNFLRTQMQADVELSIGLSAIHALAMQGSKHTDIEEEIADPTFGDIQLHVSEGLMDSSESKANWWDNQQGELPQTFPCQTVDESAGSYGLIWKSSNPPKTKVGELLGIVSKSEEGKVSVGVIRWMKNSRDKGMQFGMKMLAPHVVPVSAKDHMDPSAEFKNALYAPEVSALDKPASLLTDPRDYELGSTVVIKEGSSEIYAQLTKEVESTSSFHQYRYVEIEQSEPEKAESSHTQEDDFDSLWSVL